MKVEKLYAPGETGRTAGANPLPFKTSVITDEIDQDFETACDLACEFGLDAVEVRSVYEHGPFEFTDDDTGRIKKILANKGLKICAISSPFFKCKINSPDEINANLEGLRRCVRLSDELGVSLIRGFTFWAEPGVTAGTIASRFPEAVKILEASGKTLVLESDPSVNATNARMIVDVVEKINSPNVRALWDAGNDLWDPHGEVPYPDGYEIIKKYMVHVHLKDGRRKAGTPEGAPIGQGDVDWLGQFRALKNDGYSGYISLETHYRHSGKISEALIAMPKGAAFSLGGYEATKESLGLWKNMLAKL